MHRVQTVVCTCMGTLIHYPFVFFSVETLLNTTSMKVVVYNGQLDLIVCTPGECLVP